MIRRPLWLGAGVALGVGGTLWAEQQVRRRVQRLSAALTPGGAASEVRRSAEAARARVRGALDEVRLERTRREAELWAGLEPARAGRPAPGREAHEPGSPGGAVRPHR